MRFLTQGPKVKQFMDIFSIPEMTLLAVANDFFIANDIEYDPVHLFKDVSVSARLPPLSLYEPVAHCVFKPTDAHAEAQIQLHLTVLTCWDSSAGGSGIC